MHIYEDALRQGRSVLIAEAKDEAQAAEMREILTAAHAESIDKARHMWWLGVRDEEKEKYDAAGGNFERDEASYQKGFEAALHLNHRGKTFDAVPRSARVGLSRFLRASCVSPGIRSRTGLFESARGQSSLDAHTSRVHCAAGGLGFEFFPPHPAPAVLATGVKTQSQNGRQVNRRPYAGYCPNLISHGFS